MAGSTDGREKGLSLRLPDEIENQPEDNRLNFKFKDYEGQDEETQSTLKSGLYFKFKDDNFDGDYSLVFLRVDNDLITEESLSNLDTRVPIKDIRNYKKLGRQQIDWIERNLRPLSPNTTLWDAINAGYDI